MTVAKSSRFSPQSKEKSCIDSSTVISVSDRNPAESAKIAQIAPRVLALPIAPTPVAAQPTLRPYQAAMVRQAYRHIRNGERRILLIAVMGAGKTITASHMMADCVKRGRRAVFLVGLDVLMRQTAETLSRYGISAGMLGGGHDGDRGASVLVASVQTIARRLGRGQSLDQILGENIGLVMVDEAHIVAYSTAYGAIDAAYPDVAVIGLTATPWRLKRTEWLGQKFETTVIGPQPPEIIRQGGAVPARWFSREGVLDLDTLETTNSTGEYTDASIAKQALRPEALEAVHQEWQRLASDRPTMMVGTTVEQATVTARYFAGRGVRAETITGETPRRDRLAIFDRVRRGETKIICSVGCLTAGFDLPAISCILMVRATKSKALFHQIAGRGSRPHPDKTDYLILDFGNNQRHGNPMGYQKYSIAQPKKKEPEPLEKDCPECGAVVNVFARLCPECGHLFGDSGDSEQIDMALGQLGEVLDPSQKSQVKALRKWRKAAYENDQNPSEPIEKFIKIYHFTPPVDWSVGAILGKRQASYKRRMAYLDWVRRHCTKPEAMESWVAYHLRLEFGPGISHLEDLPWWWATLGISPGATQADLTEAYRRAIQTQTLTPEQFHELNNAFDGAIEDIKGAGQ